MKPLEERLNPYLNEHNLALTSKISKGYSSEIYKVQNPSKHEKKQFFALKIEKQKSPRKAMVEREAQNLKLANSLGIGPKLIHIDMERRIILMEFIEGITLNEFLSANPKKEELKLVLKRLFIQAHTLDKASLSHGQLGGKLANILVREGTNQTQEPVIIDFEKASTARKPNNVLQLTGMLILNQRSASAKKIKQILKQN